MLERQFPVLWVSGEISNLAMAASGHAYFSLKDASAQVRCVMFRPRVALLPFRLQEGMQVELRAVVSFYEPRGDFQLQVEMVRQAGIGQLFEAFEALKRKLSAEGLFDASRKRPLPPYPQRIGLITSPAAAALRDVLTTLKRRDPRIEVVLYPSAVQGADAPRQLRLALQQACERREVEVLVLCRGGGSLEDLWAFNDELLARAVASSPIPIVSAVGHETDFSMTDFVADVRAATPTAAAELLSPDWRQLQQRVDGLGMALKRVMTRRAAEARQRLQLLQTRLVNPVQRIRESRGRLSLLEQRLAAQMATQFQRRRFRLMQLQQRLTPPNVQRQSVMLNHFSQRIEQAILRYCELRHHRLAVLSGQLEAMNPHAVLGRGYALVQNQRGRVLTSSSQARSGEVLRVTLAQGELAVQVKGPEGLQASLDWE